jgi:cytochrome P450
MKVSLCTPLLSSASRAFLIDVSCSGADLSFGKGLFATTGDQHRKQRKMMNPLFSIAHMREMGESAPSISRDMLSEPTCALLVPTFYDVAERARILILSKDIHISGLT